MILLPVCSTRGRGGQDDVWDGGQEVGKEGGWGVEEGSFTPFYFRLPKNVGLLWG